MVRKLKQVGAAVLLLAALVGGRLWANTWYTPWMSQRAIIEQSDRFILYTLWSSGPEEGIPTQGDFHSFGILGQKEITDPVLKAKLIKALYQGLDIKDEDYAAGDCFFPGYGIRAIKGRRKVDVGLCYGCGNIEFYDGRSRNRLPTTREGSDVFERAALNAKLRTEDTVEAKSE